MVRAACQIARVQGALISRGSWKRVQINRGDGTSRKRGQVNRRCSNRGLRGQNSSRGSQLTIVRFDKVIFTIPEYLDPH